MPTVLTFDRSDTTATVMSGLDPGIFLAGDKSRNYRWPFCLMQ